MYKGILIDADPVELNKLASTIDWDYNGIKIVGFLNHCRQAQAFLENMPVDIIITGASCASGDVLTLLQFLHTRKMHARCIVITDNADFHFLQQVIPLGIENYLLQPVSDQVLLDTLHTAMDRLWQLQRPGFSHHSAGAAANDPLPLLMSQEFEELMIHQEYQQCVDYLDRLFSHAYLSAGLSLTLVRNHIIELVTYVINVMRSYNIDVGNVIGDSATLFYKILNFHDMHDLHLWMQSFMISAIDALENKKLRFSPCISRVVAMIEKNFAQDISLKTIAYELNINAAYLGQLFKMETGQLFSAFLNKTRIENAQKLLLTTTLPLSDVSQQCGYTNISYFYNIFKKHTGKTPSEYRKNKSK